MRIDSIANILEHVKAAGELALSGQRRMDFFERNYKGDGSVITGSDTEVERYLLKHIGELYPRANLLAEEKVRLYDRAKPFTVSSRIHREIDLRAFPGKIRNIGSGALHFCFPLLSPGILGAVQSPIVHIWDICGAHAINRAAGYSLEFLAGGDIDYASLTDGDSVDDFVLSGSPEGIETIRGYITRI
jgi:fructose-1,6-bisphosphatase/inositol monophosphatase family enzyme